MVDGWASLEQLPETTISLGGDALVVGERRGLDAASIGVVAVIASPTSTAGCAKEAIANLARPKGVNFAYLPDIPMLALEQSEHSS